MSENTYTEEEILTERIQALESELESCKELVKSLQEIEYLPKFKLAGEPQEIIDKYIGLRAKLYHKIKTI